MDEDKRQELKTTIQSMPGGPSEEVKQLLVLAEIYRNLASIEVVCMNHDTHTHTHMLSMGQRWAKFCSARTAVYQRDECSNVARNIHRHVS